MGPAGRNDNRIVPHWGIVVPWDDIMKPQPGPTVYRIPAKVQPIGAGQNQVQMVSAGGLPCEIAYGGVDRRGRNLGLRAVINTTSRARRGFHGQAAEGPYPYFKNPNFPPGGVQRGHLLARSLGGEGGRINWVPLKSGANLAEYNYVERDIKTFLEGGRGRWAYIEIGLDYGRFHIPVPATIVYQYALFEGAGQNPLYQARRAISNDLFRDPISWRLQRNWM